MQIHRDRLQSCYQVPKGIGVSYRSHDNNNLHNTEEYDIYSFSPNQELKPPLFIS